MPEKEKQILKNITDVMPKLTDLEKEKLLSFSEGIAFAVERQQERKEDRPA